MDDQYVLRFYVPCTKKYLEKKLEELIGYGWSSEDLQSMRICWNQLTNLKMGDSIDVDENALGRAIKFSVIELYSSRYWFSAFEGVCKPPERFTAYPPVPTLWAGENDWTKPKDVHYLWRSLELREALLQLWLYCEQDSPLFNAVVSEVWKIYGEYSKFECGYGGEADKFAAALRITADRFKKCP
jgi:hypothetical protein